VRWNFDADTHHYPSAHENTGSGIPCLLGVGIIFETDSVRVSLNFRVRQ
jgi:hypothetical protein